jgi:hypothetical protein
VFNESTMAGSLMWLFIIIFFGAIILGIICGIGFAIWGLISTKMWEHFTVDFNDEFTEEELDDAWAAHEIKKHYRFIGFRKYGIWDTDTDKWYGSIHFQFLKYWDKELFRWHTKKGLWD